MATKEDLDLDVKSGSKLNTILLIMLIVLVLVGVGAAWYLMSGNGETAQETATVETRKPESLPMFYLKLSPEFVINFEDTSKARYLQLEVQLMARNQAVLRRVEAHMPIIRNELLILLSGQTFEELSSRAGKEKLRGEVLAAVNGVLRPASEAERVEAVYFTSLIMQ